MALPTILVPAAYKADVTTGAPAAILGNKVFLSMEATAWRVKERTSRSLDLVIRDLSWTITGQPGAAGGLPLPEREIHIHVI